MAPVVVLGPTASGKSDVAMAAALAVQGTQIVAVDAMQVYRGMDIGTAKPSAADRAAVPHHGLDLTAPTESFSVVDYRIAYDRFRPTIPGRPLLVAGTGLYLTAVLDRLDLPGEWPDVRAELDAELDAGASLGTLHE
ncbi:MAG: tRNA (adenosine(37)-N6)-dimethylallyltransferase MiaA, partial [Actinomycetota bacterium]|nr:tRNA (adenosine(37)-N6)-dimethylallyltransferase MiaA [Actinomycetota bacterium]